MSGLYLLALIGLWLFVGRIIYRLWRRWQPQELKRKVFHLVAGLLLFSLWFGGAFWEVTGKKMYWDAQVRKLCAKDGGVKVYETVELTPGLINRGGGVSIPSKRSATAEDLYFYEMEDQYLRKNNPSLIRTSTVVIRRRDHKVLGKSISYSRGGGDLHGPWHPSAFLCPDPTKGNSVLSAVFIKGDDK